MPNYLDHLNETLARIAREETLSMETLRAETLSMLDMLGETPARTEGSREYRDLTEPN